MITQLVMIAILIGLLVIWHLNYLDVKHPGEEIEDRFLADMEF
jgi:hypothetical protein